MSTRHSRSTVLTVAVLMIGALTACGAGAVDEGPEPASFEAVSTHTTTKVDWEESWDSAFSRARTEGKPVLTGNATEDARFRAQESVINYAIGSVISVPLIAKEKGTIGVITSTTRSIRRNSIAVILNS